MQAECGLLLPADLIFMVLLSNAMLASCTNTGVTNLDVAVGCTRKAIPCLMMCFHELLPLNVQVVLRTCVDIALAQARCLTLLSCKSTQQLLLPACQSAQPSKPEELMTRTRKLPCLCHNQCSDGPRQQRPTVCATTAHEHLPHVVLR